MRSRRIRLRACLAPAARAAGRGGFTLVEMLTVLVVLVAVAAVVLPRVEGFSSTARHQATQATLANLRDAIVGTAGWGYLHDVGDVPVRMRDLFIQPDGVPDFRVETGVGWRGPYLATSTGMYRPNTEEGFTARYGKREDPAILDAWGEPIVIQIPATTEDGVPTPEDRRHARLVSAGPDGEIDTPLGVATTESAWYPALQACDDDLVLYLRVPDLRR